MSSVVDLPRLCPVDGHGLLEADGSCVRCAYIDPVVTVTSVTSEDDRPAWQRRTSWTAPDLLAADFPPLRWAVPSLLPEGCALLVGAPKVGKSWAALDVALAVASGGRAFGALEVESGSVLYLALEDGPRRLADRVRLLLGGTPPPTAFTAYTGWAKGIDAVRDAAAWLDAHPDARLVVVDVLAKVRARRVGGGDRYAEDYADLSLWQQLATRYRVTLLLLHHDRKASADDFVDAVSGTHGVAGSADSVLLLTRARMENYGSLSLTGRDVPEHEIALRRVGPIWQHHDGPLPDPNLGDRSTAILTLAAEHPEGIRAAHVADVVGMPEADSRQYLRRLAESGRLTKRERGLYAVPVTDVTLVTPLLGDASHDGDRRDTP